MEFFINKKVFGSPFNIICKDNGEIVKTDEHPTDILDASSKEAWLLSKLFGFDLPRFPPKKFVRSMEHVTPIKEDMPWFSILPENVYKKEVKKFIGRLQDSFGTFDFSYYRDSYCKHTPLFEALRPAKVNTNIFLENLDKNFGDHDSIKTFVPENGFTAKPYYDRFGTITGRLKIAKGPNILNLKKDYRHMLESRFGKNGKIYYLDYSSLEPRTILSINGKKNIPQDVYTHILNEIGLKNVSRAAIKISVLSKIYGSSDAAIIKQLKGVVDYPEDLINMVTDYFGIEQLKQNVSQEYFKSDGRFIKNYYGRYIQGEEIPPYRLLNYYIQSTAVDIALTGFTNIINRVKLAGLENYVVPIFLLHDAIFFDIHNDYEYLVPKLCKAASVNINGLEETNFYLKVESKWFIDENNRVMIVED